MISVINNDVTMCGSYADLDAEVAMIIFNYAVNLQKNGISSKQICDDLLNYMKLLTVITECLTKGDNLEDNLDSILERVFD